MAASARLKVPGFGLPVNHFPAERFPVLIGDKHLDWAARTLTLRELCMLNLVEELTNKPEWWTKVRDPDIARRWKAEALATDWAAYWKHADFTPAMADACIAELRYKADLYETTGLIPVFDYSACVIKSDRLVSQSLWQDLRDAVAPLEDVSAGDKDWHPGSDDKVLDLVHPSLYPLVYGRSRILPDKRIRVDDALEHCGAGEVIAPPEVLKETPDSWFVEEEKGGTDYLSLKFQWLPCDVLVDGRRAKIDSYINNLHPKRHAAVYSVIERFIETALPAWDVVYRWPWEFDMQRLETQDAEPRCRTGLTCWKSRYTCTPRARPVRDDEPPRKKTDEGAYEDDELEESDDDESQPGSQDEDSEYESEGMDSEEAMRRFGPAEDPEGQDEEEEEGDDDDDADYDDDGVHRISHAERKRRDFRWFYKTHPMRLPDSEPGQHHVRLKADDVDFKRPLSRLPTDVTSAEADKRAGPEDGSRRIQVIVKLANIHLDPSKPSYDGGSWHVEGQVNERICATALFYYDSHNVTDSHLAFRTAANAELLDEASNLEYKQYDWGSIARVFAIDPSLRDKSQELGGVPTLPGRALFFPNVYQHRVGPFRLADATRPGHRKILALFLVDPAVPVISTSSVPPQQQAWWDEQLRGQHDSLVSRLPQEVLGMIMENVSDSAITDDEAKRLRAELMEERTRHRDKAEENLIFAEWDFCEH